MLALATAAMASANPISENQAQSVASRFMPGKSMQRVALQRANRAPSRSQAAYYVFNAQSSEGYVIVSGDDRVPPILGYSDSGTFDPTNVPEAMQQLLDGYAAQIAELPEDISAPQQVSRTPIAPLVTSIWGQGNPFSNNLPFIRTVTTSSGETRALHAVTGCVATAMAQIMYYHKWPEKSSQTIPAYTSSTTIDGKTVTFQRPALEPATFDWASMKDSYNSTDSANASGQAVARLMEYCDQALQMHFNEESSSAHTMSIPTSLYYYFGYDEGVRYVSRSSYSTTEWEDMLYAELQAKRPVAYCGSKSPGGHAFVCDGCDANGLFHINWGWNSASDGYFLLRDLNPRAQGTGSANGSSGYIHGQGMVIGIQPEAGGQSTFSIAIRSLIYNADVTTLPRASSSDDFKVSVTGRFFNISSYDATFDFGWGLYQGETLIKPLVT
ncbi:MAG: C10 family peptidase, partial [Muribaculaceae bacterium]|nr:C10 family peptidase [Muribaculaceae bacterium]